MGSQVGYCHPRASPVWDGAHERESCGKGMGRGLVRLVLAIVLPRIARPSFRWGLGGNEKARCWRRQPEDPPATVSLGLGNGRHCQS